MATMQVNPTRMELKRLKTRLAVARRGHKLLKDKRDELMKQFLDIVRETKTLRERVEKSLGAVQSSFRMAAAVSSPKLLKEELMLPKKDVLLEVDSKNIMSVNVPVFHFDTAGTASDSYNFGLAFTGGELDAAIAELSSVLPDMLKLAELEKTSQLLAEEIERVRRRVNALEYIMIPQFEEAIKSITMKLGESERANLTRLMKVKDMMLKEANAKKAQAEW